MADQETVTMVGPGGEIVVNKVDVEQYLAQGFELKSEEIKEEVEE